MIYNDENIQQVDTTSGSNNHYTNRKFCRSNSDYIFFGLIGGFAEYNSIEPLWIRLFLALSLLLNPFLISLYFIVALLTPKCKNIAEIKILEKNIELNKLFLIGLIFLFTGLFYFFYSSDNNDNFIYLIANDELILSILFLFAGLYNLLFTSNPKIISTEKVYYRGLNQKKLLGVCSGFAKYFGIDLSLVRFIFVLITIMTAGVFAIVYLYLGISTEGKYEIIF